MRYVECPQCHRKFDSKSPGECEAFIYHKCEDTDKQVYRFVKSCVIKRGG